MNPSPFEDLEGARIQYVEQREDGQIIVAFGFRATDDGSGYMVVAPDAIHFADQEGEPQ